MPLDTQDAFFGTAQSLVSMSDALADCSNEPEHAPANKDNHDFKLGLQVAVKNV
jgi:hypothetical protein